MAQSRFCCCCLFFSHLSVSFALSVCPLSLFARFSHLPTHPLPTACLICCAEAVGSTSSHRREIVQHLLLRGLVRSRARNLPLQGQFALRQGSSRHVLLEIVPGPVRSRAKAVIGMSSTRPRLTSSSLGLQRVPCLLSHLLLSFVPRPIARLLLLFGRLLIWPCFFLRKPAFPAGLPLEKPTYKHVPKSTYLAVAPQTPAAISAVRPGIRLVVKGFLTA